MTPLNELTFNEHVNAAITMAADARTGSSQRSRDETFSEEYRKEHEAAARELSIAITHLEDALNTLPRCSTSNA